jgi:hypothetical protein
MSTKNPKTPKTPKLTKKQSQSEDKYKEPFKLTVNRTGRSKSELSVQEVKPFAPSIPVIDLIPSSLVIRYDKEKLITRFANILGGVVIVFVAIWGLNFLLAGIQSTNNVNTQGQIDALQKQLGDVEGYRVYADGIKLVRENMYDVVKNNVDMGEALETIVGSANGNNINITTIKLTESATTTEQNICVNSSAFKSASQIGCVSISGSAKSNTAVIKFFDDILKNSGFSDSFINSIGVSGDSIVFSGTISLTEELKINRYDYLSTQLVTIDKILGTGGLSDDVIAKLIAGGSTATPTPSPTPTPTPTETAAADLDPKFDSCEAAIAEGYGPYERGIDAEYAYYEDTNNDGTVCES